MRKFYFLFTALSLIFFSEPVIYAQCEQFAASVANFANADVGEVLCDGADGCEAGGFEISGFQVYINEAYLLGKLYPGAEYVFDICEGYNANTWRAELTALEYINADTPIVVSGTVMGTVKDCELIFTVPSTYTQAVDVMVIISEEGSCGGDVVETDNGFPYFGCGANGGQPSCDLSEIACDDPRITAGIASFSSENVCFNDTLFFSSDTPFAPISGAVSGFSWLISSEDISGDSNPFVNPDLILGGYDVVAATSNDFIFINNGDFEAGTYYFTPIVFGNGAGNANDAIFNIVLEPTCTFVGESTAINVLGVDSPFCADCEPPTVEIFTSECGEEGLFELEVDVSFGSSDSYTVVDSLSGFSQVLTSEGTAILGPYEGGEVALWVVGEGNPDCNLFFVVADYCPVLCNVVKDGGFEELNNSWTEFEEPNQPDFTIIDDEIRMIGDYAAYLGGYQTEQITNISQSINIPNTQTATLTFYGLFYCADVNDNFKVLIDNVPILNITGDNEALCSDVYFNRFELDVSDFADGNSHTLQFSLFGTNAGYTAFFLDDVQLNACSCIADAGTLQMLDDPILCADSTDDFQAQNNSDGYIGALSAYLYFLVDANGNIAANSTDGRFDFDGIASGDYEVYGLSLFIADVEEIQTFTHLDQIQYRLEFGSLCADLTDATYTLTYDANCVGIEEIASEKDFEITRIFTLDATSLKIDFQAKKMMDLQVLLYDVNGRLLQGEEVKTAMGTNELTLATASIESGVYLLVLTDGRSLVSQRFLKIGF